MNINYTLYSLYCCILKDIESYIPEKNFFNQVKFDVFRRKLDWEMKRLTSQVVGVEKKTC